MARVGVKIHLKWYRTKPVNVKPVTNCLIWVYSLHLSVELLHYWYAIHYGIGKFVLRVTQSSQRIIYFHENYLATSSTINLDTGKITKPLVKITNWVQTLPNENIFVLFPLIYTKFQQLTKNWTVSIMK